MKKDLKLTRPRRVMRVKHMREESENLVQSRVVPRVKEFIRPGTTLVVPGFSFFRQGEIKNVKHLQRQNNRQNE